MRKKKVFSLLLSLTLAVTSLTACGGGNGESLAESKDTASAVSGEESEVSDVITEDEESGAYAVTDMEDTTIHIRVMNDYGYIDDVLAKYNELTADDPIMSKIHLDFEYVGGGDYSEKLSMAVTTEEDYDLMFCGSWHGFSNYAATGAFADLSKYFNNDNFPGLKAAFTQEQMDAAASYIQNEDGSWSSRIYRIPLLEQIEDVRGLYYRADLAEQLLGTDEITNDEQMYELAKAVTESDKLENYYGLSLWGGFMGWTRPDPDIDSNVFRVAVFNDNYPFYVRLSEDNATVLGAAIMGDDNAAWSFMPEDFQYDFISEWYMDLTKWAPYMDPVRGTTETSTGTAAISYGTLTEGSSQFSGLYENETIMSEFPDADLAFYPIFENARNKKADSIVSEMIANNQLVVPSWSEKIDAVMCFLNWMFLNQENHDLFQYGIEGVDWEAVGDGGYRLLDRPEDKTYSMPGYSFCWNPVYARKSEFVSNNEQLDAYYDFMMDPESYRLSPLAGFSFNTAGLETEISGLSAISGELLLDIAYYDKDETQSIINDWYAKAQGVGLEKVRDELIDQLQAFLDMKNAQ